MIVRVVVVDQTNRKALYNRLGRDVALANRRVQG